VLLSYWHSDILHASFDRRLRDSRETPGSGSDFPKREVSTKSEAPKQREEKKKTKETAQTEKKKRKKEK
jgi:hypothetical protein